MDSAMRIVHFLFMGIHPLEMFLGYQFFFGYMYYGETI